MAERSLRAQLVSVANHVKARRSLIERSVTWLATGWARSKRSAICSGKLCWGFIIFEQCIQQLLNYINFYRHFYLPVPLCSYSVSCIIVGESAVLWCIDIYTVLSHAVYCCSTTASHHPSKNADSTSRRPVPRLVRGIRSSEQPTVACRVVTRPWRRPVSIGEHRGRHPRDCLGYGPRRWPVPMHGHQRCRTTFVRNRARHLRSVTCFSLNF